MNNIFKNAYFGKAYKTRGGRKAIYIYYGTDVIERFIERHHLIYEGLNSIEPSNYEEIVSEWEEEINEEVLCETALNFVAEFLNKNEICLVPYKNYNEIGDGTWNNNHFNCNDLTEAFEAGYRKAKEE